MFQTSTSSPLKTIVAIMTVFISMNICGQQIEIPDPVLFEFIVNNYTGVVGTDNSITEVEALNITGKLDLSGQTISNLTGLEKFTQLDSVSVSGLGLSQFPTPPEPVKWVSLDLSGNNLQELPALNNIPDLKHLKLGGNKLTFHDLLPLAQDGQFTFLQVSDLGQQQIELPETMQVEMGEDLEINLNFDSQVSGNEYKWFKNGVQFWSGNSPTLKRESVSSLDNGNYYCEISNSNFPITNYKLKTTTISVSIIGQDVTITDANVRQCLSDNYPDLINSAQRLNKYVSQNYSGNLNCSNYSIERFPELSYFKSISSLDLSNNKLTTIEGLQNMTKLKELILNQNELTTLPALSTTAQVQKMNLSNNRFEDLPYFNLEQVTDLNIKENNLSFEDFEQFQPGDNALENLILTPQQLIGPAPYTDTVSAEGTITIALNIDEYISGNTYEWYLNNEFYTTTAMNKLVISDSKVTDSGIYHAIVRNSKFNDSGIFLQSNNYRIVVGGCFEPENIILDIQPATCQIKGSVQIDESSLMGASFPITYEIIDQGNNQHISSDNGRFDGLDAGSYTLIINQEDQCTLILSDAFELLMDSDNCDIVISPNGSSQSFYIEAEGTAKIYNSAGQLVRELSIPAHWDGKTNNGHIQSDQYFIQVNEEALIPVSVVR